MNARTVLSLAERYVTLGLSSSAAFALAFEEVKKSKGAL